MTIPLSLLAGRWSFEPSSTIPAYSLRGPRNYSRGGYDRVRYGRGSMQEVLNTNVTLWQETWILDGTTQYGPVARNRLCEHPVHLFRLFGHYQGHARQSAVVGRCCSGAVDAGPAGRRADGPALLRLAETEVTTNVECWMAAGGCDMKSIHHPRSKIRSIPSRVGYASA